jgi:bifunctional non-homologous end joining protein LigD
LANTEPARYTISAVLEERPGRLFIDFLRNGRGTTAVAVYSPRARPGFPIAAPITWKDVERGVRSDQFTIGETAAPAIRAADFGISGAAG